MTIQEFDELEFDEIKHEYKLNGFILPSVTQLMHPLTEQEYSSVSDSTLQAAADRGTNVHKAIEFHCKYDFDDINSEQLGYLEAFEKWEQEHKVECLANEHKVYHQYLRYAGTADMLAVVDGVPTIVDFKTTSKVNEMLTGVQLEAYSQAYKSHGIEFEQKIILHITKDGDYQCRMYPALDNESWKVFTACITINNHIKKFKKGS